MAKKKIKTCVVDGTPLFMSMGEVGFTGLRAAQLAIREHENLMDELVEGRKEITQVKNDRDEWKERTELEVEYSRGMTEYLEALIEEVIPFIAAYLAHNPHAQFPLCKEAGKNVFTKKEKEDGTN